MSRLGLIGVIVMALASVSACDGAGAGTDPTGICSCIAGGGLVTATMDGQPLVANVQMASYYGDQGLFVFSAAESNQRQLFVYARARVGQVTLGPDAIDPDTGKPSTFSAQLVLPATGGASTNASWITSVLGGAGTIAVNSVSPTGASGSFSFTMVPMPGTPTTGTHQMSGTFDVRF